MENFFFSTNYSVLEEHYGAEKAYKILTALEKTARIQAKVTKALYTREERLQRAVQRLADMHYVTA